MTDVYCPSTLSISPIEDCIDANGWTTRGNYNIIFICNDAVSFDIDIMFLCNIGENVAAKLKQIDNTPVAIYYNKFYDKVFIERVSDDMFNFIVIRSYPSCPPESFSCTRYKISESCLNSVIDGLNEARKLYFAKMYSRVGVF